MAYVEGLPRVSHIVGLVFPFEGEGKKRFHLWLEKKNIDVDHYMNVANSYGTAIHLWLERYIIGQNTEQTEKGMEDYILCKENNEKYVLLEQQYEPHLTKYVGYGICFLKENNVLPIHTEHYICVEGKYQGTIDLIGEIDWEKWVLDWKSYSCTQEILWIRKWEYKYKKPYTKLVKASLQLSLYALPLGIKNIWVVELAYDWYHFHKLSLYSQEEIDIIVNNYHLWTTTKNVLNAEAKT